MVADMQRQRAEREDAQAVNELRLVRRALQKVWLESVESAGYRGVNDKEGFECPAKDLTVALSMSPLKDEPTTTRV